MPAKAAHPAGPGDPTEQGPERPGTDVEEQRFRQHSLGADPLPSRPLSSTSMEVAVFVPPGELTGGSASRRPPTARPGRPSTSGRTSWPGKSGGAGVELTGTVTDQS